ncbi:MAG TPA: carboxypeptidase-like regulatory domain-containing protein [Edaphobacter sp.]
MSSSLKRAGLGALLLHLVILAHVYAQTAADGAIRGLVLDPAGAPMSSVTIQAEDLATHLILHTTTTRSGEFILPTVPSGQYQLTISASGFSSFTLPLVAVEVGSVTEVQTRLKVAWTSTNIAVAPESAATGLEETSPTNPK